DAWRRRLAAADEGRPDAAFEMLLQKTQFNAGEIQQRMRCAKPKARTTHFKQRDDKSAALERNHCVMLPHVADRLADPDVSLSNLVDRLKGHGPLFRSDVDRQPRERRRTQLRVSPPSRAVEPR
ncbi:MAG: hypothetical protein AAGM38_17590, partial [Pseudomonadota bacterium]